MTFSELFTLETYESWIIPSKTLKAKPLILGSKTPNQISFEGIRIQIPFFRNHFTYASLKTKIFFEIVLQPDTRFEQ